MFYLHSSDCDDLLALVQYKEYFCSLNEPHGHTDTLHA